MSSEDSITNSSMRSKTSAVIHLSTADAWKQKWAYPRNFLKRHSIALTCSSVDMLCIISLEHCLLVITIKKSSKSYIYIFTE